MWMAGEAYCQKKLYEAAQVADLILVEGAMGLFDGEPSSADLAARFNIPVALLMDVKGMAQTAAAIATGLANFRNDFRVAGLLANNCGSERHAQLIRDALPENLPLLAVLKRDPAVALPERHLGLVQACEVRDELEIRLDTAADWLQASGLAIDSQAQAHQVEFSAPQDVVSKVEPVLANKTIAIASDEAFSFIYDANIKQLQALGAKVTTFSPLHDSSLPQADGLWLPGGYPELHAKQLAGNTEMLQSIQAFYRQGKPILAECGGFLYCLETLTDLDESQYRMLGLLDGHGAMRGKRGCQGMQTAPLPEGEVRAHAHHRSRSFDTAEPIAHGRRQRHPAPGEAIYRQGQLTASYLHLFFPSNPEAIGALFSGQEIVHV
jgi:cobyrinic acid a,c-diamide synthase